MASALADREVRSLQARDVAAYARWLSTRPRAVRGAGGAYERPAGGKPIPWSACGQLLRLVASGEDVPVALIHQVAAAALLELQGAGALAARALGEGPHALGAAIELAGRLLELRDSFVRGARLYLCGGVLRHRR